MDLNRGAQQDFQLALGPGSAIKLLHVGLHKTKEELAMYLLDPFPSITVRS